MFVFPIPPGVPRAESFQVKNARYGYYSNAVICQSLKFMEPSESYNMQTRNDQDILNFICLLRYVNKCF